VVWLVALPGGLLALVRARRRPEAAVVAVAALGIVLVSAVFFGTPRLRTPYDPLAFVLVAGGAAALLDRVRSSTGFSRGRA
jgi:peptidoglycan/LPS O-acetylase OafA/YrhL